MSIKRITAIMLYTGEQRVDSIIEALANCAHGSGVRTGIVAVESIDRLVSLERGADVDPETL